MNDWDRNNLNFIRSLNEKQFEEWASTITEDDVNYAIEILRMARVERIEQQLTLLDEVNSTADADEYLRKFRL